LWLRHLDMRHSSHLLLQELLLRLLLWLLCLLLH
jgi:hypothetical protein